VRIAIVMRGESIVGGGGAERRFVRLFKHLCAHGCDIHLVINRQLFESALEARLLEQWQDSSVSACSALTPPLSGGYSSRIHLFDDKHGVSSLNLLAFNLFVMRIIQDKQIELVHLPLLQKSLTPFYLWLYLFPTITVINTVAHSGFASQAKLPRGLLGLAKLLWYRANAIDSLYAGFLSHHGKSFLRKVSITPGSFTDTEQYIPIYPKTKEMVFAGRLIAEKNPLLLVKALAALRSEGKHLLDGWQVHILGRGPLEHEVEAEVVRQGLSDVVCVGHAGSISRYLNRSRIFVSLQSTENYPSQSLLEAMAAGNATAATDVGETRRLVDESTGILVPMGDYRALAKALKELIYDEEQCYRMGVAARNRVVNGFSLTKFTDYMQGVWINARSGVQ